MESSNGVGGKKSPRKITTKVVVVISNYHFNRDEQVAEFKPCTLADCTVGLKYSSNEFSAVGSDKDGGFQFDRFGVLAPYEAFVSLFTNAEFGVYLEKCKAKFLTGENKANREIAPEGDDASDAADAIHRDGGPIKTRRNKTASSIIVNDDEDEEEEEAGPPEKKTA